MNCKIGDIVQASSGNQYLIVGYSPIKPHYKVKYWKIVNDKTKSWTLDAFATSYNYKKLDSVNPKIVTILYA